MKELESLGVKLDSALDKVNVDRLVASDMKNLNEENVGSKYKRAKWIVRVLALLAEWALVLSLVSCGSDKYTGIDLISKAVRLDFSSWKDWGQVALLVASVLCIAVIVISLFESNKIFHKILSMTSAIFITSLVALAFYKIEGSYKVLKGFYVLVLLYGGMFLISVRGKACELILLDEEIRRGKSGIVPLFNWSMLKGLCIGQIVINFFMYIYSKKIMDDSGLTMIAVIVLAWSAVTLIITLMKMRRCELCFMIQTLSSVVMMAIGVGFCMHYRIRFRYLLDIMLWLGCLLVSPYRKLKMPDLRDIKTCQHKIKNDSAKIIKEVQIGIQSIDVEGLKSDLSSTYEAVKQTVKETGKAVKSEEHENQSAELKDKLKRIFIKVKPVLKSKVVLVAIGVIVVTVSFGNMISNHKKLEEIYYNNYNAYQSFVRNSSKNIRSVEEAYEDLFNSLDRIEELKEAKKSYRSVLDGEERAARRLEKEYGKDSMAFELAYAFGYEPAYDDWAKVTDELYDLVEACANREEMLKETRRSLYDMKESLHKIIDNVEPYKNNNEFFFKGILSDVNREIKNNKLGPTIEKINRCLEVCELYGDLAAERYMGYR